MKVLTLNCGSSSVKFSLIETSLEQIKACKDVDIARGSVDKIGLPSSVIKINAGAQTFQHAQEILDHRDAVDAAIQLLCNCGIVASRSEIEAVGHRIVHGGERFSTSVLIDDDVMGGIEKCVSLAPLHNPHNLAGIRAAIAALPGKAQVAVFDTGFHATIPDYAYRYAIPEELYRRHQIRKYGFHGLSHRFVSYRLAQILRKPRSDFKIITAHLGNGCSLAAIKHGISIATTMGFTPCEGLVMGTRPGSMDPSIILHVIAKEELTIAEADALLNKHSGLYGLSGVANDMREILAERGRGNDRARLAIDVFVHTLKRYIGSYLAVLGGADAIVFTGGIGENMPEVRRRSLEGMEFAGVRIAPDTNEKMAPGTEGKISADDSPTIVYVIPTNEELVIARDTIRVLLTPH